MSTEELSSIQDNHQEVEGIDHTVQESKKPSIRVSMKHVFILGGLAAFAPLSTDTYLPALPAVSHDLGATMSLTQITLTAGILGLGFGQLIIGPISDARGRRWPLLIGITAFVLASLLCIVAPSVTVLSLLRFVQGFTGAAGVVLAFAIARDLYSGDALARCVSLLMTVNFLAPIVAPVLGGQLLAFTSWHGVFVFLALLGLAALLVSIFGLGETLEKSHRQTGGLVSTWRAFRDILANRRFVGYTLSSSFAFAACIVYISISPFILENIYGLSPQIFSLVFGINALGLAGASQLSARLVGKVSPQKLLAIGVGVLALVGITLLGVAVTKIGLVGLLPLLFVLVACLGIIAPNATALALGTTTPQTAGSASGLIGMAQLTIGAVLAPLVGLGGTTTAIPMATAIAVFGLAALISFLVLCRPGTIEGHLSVSK